MTYKPLDHPFLNRLRTQVLYAMGPIGSTLLSYELKADDFVAFKGTPQEEAHHDCPEWLNVASFMLGDPSELALVGPLPALSGLCSVVNELYRPNLVVAAGPVGDQAVVPLLAQRSMVNGLPTAYLCRRMTCQAPVTGAAELRRLLSGQ